MNYNDEAKVDEQGRNNDQGFDFTKYLTDSQIEDIAKKVCEEELRKYICGNFSYGDFKRRGSLFYYLSW